MANKYLKSSKIEVSKGKMYMIMTFEGDQQYKIATLLQKIQPVINGKKVTDVLLLDEPTTYLDIYHQIEILELVKKLNEDHGITIIMVLHDINQAIKYSDNIVIMKDGGRIIEEGKPEKVINENKIKSVYNVEGVICNVDKEEMYFVPTKAC